MWHIRGTIFAMEKQKCVLVVFLAYYIAVKNIVITDGVAMEMRQCVPLNAALHFVANNKNTHSFSCMLPETNLAFADRF
jgi:hypothetical protein